MTVVMIAQAALWIWFFGCVVTYRAGKILLVDGMGIKSAEFAVLCVYSVSLILYHLFHPAGKWILLALLILWFAVQFFCHWFFTIFGAGERKIKGYNDSFTGTVRLFPASEKRVVPDLYHIILHALIIANIVVIIMRP